jgi:hypothetical protein
MTLSIEDLKNVKIQYVKKGRQYHKKTEVLDESGNRIPGSGKRSKGIKRGVFFSGCTPDNNIVIGFSLVHKNDLYDIIGGKWVEVDGRNGNKKMEYVKKGRQYHKKTEVLDESGNRKRPKRIKQEGFGVNLAYTRAMKWSNYGYYRIAGGGGNVWDNTSAGQYVYIPQSIKKKFARFIERCNRYYKGSHLPEWAVKFIR